MYRTGRLGGGATPAAWAHAHQDIRYGARPEQRRALRRLTVATGHAGGGGVTKDVRVCLAIASTLLPASQVTTHVEMMEVQNETA